MKRFRETKLGRFVTQAEADADPAGTVAETVSDAPQVEAALRWRISKLEAAMVDVAANLRRDTTGKTKVLLADHLETVAHDRIPDEHA